MPKSISLTPPPEREHDVGRLDVAMDDGARVAVLERLRAGADDAQRLERRHPRLVGKEGVQPGAFHVFHRVVVGAVRLAMVVDPHDVRVVEPFEREHLALEPLQEGRPAVNCCGSSFTAAWRPVSESRHL